ncbi:hypothetical protein [Thalassobius sp. MITS945101]|uniref:hypothetical protein n=1 Tax=Thalassobius sp. MITS945101 TaxID=3096994 RepID=UPI00399AFB86
MFERLFYVLSKVFGKERALRKTVFLYRYGGLLPAAPLLALLAYFFVKAPHWVQSDRVGYAWAEVESILPLPSETGPQKLVVRFTTEHDAAHQVVVRARGWLAGTLDRVCVQERRFADREGGFFKIVRKQNCLKADAGA